MSNLNLRQYENESTLLWLVNNINLPKGLAWSFEDRPWQIDIIEDQSKYIVTRKPTQIGMSTVFLGKMLYFADKNQCRLMYTLPRQDDVSDMVYSRLQEIVSESPYIQSRMGDVDNVRMKRFGKSWLHFAEMSVPPRMMDVDWMLNDEIDLSNQEHLEQAASRMDASKFGVRHQISTPTIDNFGVDALYKLSDQKNWVVKCPYCSHEQVMDWSENVLEKNGRVYYACSRCHNPLHPDDIREGRWVPMGNTNSTLSGYQISHLMVPYIDPNKLWIEYKTMSTKNFYNFRLGLPYTPSSGAITRTLIEQNCFDYVFPREESSSGGRAKYILGADQGNTITYSVGRIMEDGTIEIVSLGEIPFENGFDELGRLINRFNPQKVVLDALPNHHSSMKLAQEFGGKISIAYFSNIKDLFRQIEDFKVNINKTDAYDALLSNIADRRIQFYHGESKWDSHVEKAIQHLNNMRRDIVEMTNRATGQTTTHIWKNTGPDHFADAIVYMLVAGGMVEDSKISLVAYDLSNPDTAKEISEMPGAYDDEFFDPSNSNEVLDERGFVVDLERESMLRLNNPELMPDNPYKALRQLYMGYDFNE